MVDYSEEHLVDSDFAVDGSVFPNEFVNPDIKEKKPYGLKYAKAMYYSSGRFGINNSFWDTAEYDVLMEIAQGRQSVENIRKMFGFFHDTNDDARDDGSASLSYLDVQVLNLAPKYINRAVEKIINRKYEVQLAAIDPVSVHDKANYEANLRTYYELREWFSNMSMSPREFFPELDVDVLPEYPDEVMYELLTNPKIRKAIDGELSLTLLQEINDFNQKMRMVAWDIVVFGRGHLECYRDENGIPRVKKINPKYYLGSFVEDENFQEQEYAGYLDFPTVNQFRKEASATMSEEEIQKIVSQYAFQNDNSRSIDPTRQNQNYDGLNYIPVMRFYFLSEDSRLYITRRNQFGNITMMERNLNWKGKEGSYEGIIKNSYTTVYGGTWVLDSNCVYNYGPKSYNRSNLVDTTLPIITFSPNYKDGRTVSFAAQMIEPLFMINLAWNKIKEIMAKGWMGFQEIDFTQLEAVSLNKGGKSWSPRQVYKHFLQTGRLVKRSQTNKYDQRYSSSAVEGNAGGLMLSDYFTTFTTGINMLEQMTATTVAESANQPDRLAVRVMQQSQETGDLDMGYLFNAYEYVYREANKQMLLALQRAKQDGVGISGFVLALGKHITVPDHIAHCDYGLFLIQAPSDYEWANFYEELQIGLQNGTITHLDSAFIREVRNLKKARQVLAIRIKINERKAAQMNQQNIKAQMEASSMAAQEKTQGDLAVVQAKSQAKLEEIRLQGMIDERLKAMDKQMEAAISDREYEAKQKISKQASVDEIIKQSVRNKGEFDKEVQKSKTKNVPSPTKK